MNKWGIAFLVSVLLLAGCGGVDTTSTPTSTSVLTTGTTPTTATTTSSAPPTVSGPPSAGTMAEEGRGVFAVSCAQCHGTQGQGSSETALIGPGSALSQYGTAGALLAFISRAMPYGDPGSLTALQYHQVVAFLTVEDGLVDPDVVWENLADIGLSKAD